MEGAYDGYNDAPDHYKDDFFVEGVRGWDGRDDLGTALASGVYYARFEGSGARQGLKLVLTR